MCGLAKRAGRNLTPGSVLPVSTTTGKIDLTWGFNSGRVFNVRVESLYTTWHKMVANKCIMEVDSFVERHTEFASNGIIKLGGIFNPESKEFAIITVDADPLVRQYHHRMPLIIDDDNYFLNTERFDLNRFHYYLKLAG